LKTIVSCSAIALAGCATPNQPASMQPVQPVSRLVHSKAVADPDYQIGRMHQDRREYEAAIVAYRKSLESHPGNAEAHNALGVVYAALGKNDQAITEFIAARALAPSSAHVYNNLGYAYLLAGRNEDAVAALKQGNRLSPGNARLIANLRTAENRLAAGTPKPAAAAPQTAVAKPRTEEPSADPSVPRLVTVAPNVFELRQATPPVKPPVPPVPPGPPVSASESGAAVPSTMYIAAALDSKPVESNLKLEIANGNGTPGLAKRTSLSLQQSGFSSFRLTNQIPYTQKLTEIQFRPGEQAQAERLNALLATPAKLVPATRLNLAVGVRLVLGHDSGRKLVLKDPGGALASDRSDHPAPRG
jgi:tetratricopeptide (TPR) repeat protein